MSDAAHRSSFARFAGGRIGAPGPDARRAATSTTAKRIIAKETAFWQAMRDQDVRSAVDLLDDTAILAGMRGIPHFDHAGYRRMAEPGPMKPHDFSLSDERVVFRVQDVAVATYTVSQDFSIGEDTLEMVSYDTSTWVRKDGK
jgi:hypothetical protein